MFYAAEFDTVELNASFYRWPKPSTFAGWRERLPEGFTMTVKAYLGSDARRLQEPVKWIERIAADGPSSATAAPRCVEQLHPAQERDDETAGSLLTRRARRDSGGDGTAPIPPGMPRRWTTSCATRRRLRRDERAGVAVHRHGHRGPGLPGLHGPDDAPSTRAATATPNCAGGRAEQIRVWDREGRDVLVYFNNDLGGHAVQGCAALVNAGVRAGDPNRVALLLGRPATDG